MRLESEKVEGCESNAKIDERDYVNHAYKDHFGVKSRP